MDAMEQLQREAALLLIKGSRLEFYGSNGNWSFGSVI
jgi:hypothetical protein